MRRRLRTFAWLTFALVQAALLAFPAHAVLIYSLCMMAATGSGAVLHAVFAVRSRGHARRVWTLTTIGVACWAYAEFSVGLTGVATGEELSLGPPATVLSLSAFGFAVAGMLSIPIAPRGAGGKIRMIFDGLVAACALMGAAWLVLLDPLTEAAGESSALLDLTYPVLAAGVLAIALVLLSGRSPRRLSAMTVVTGGVVLLTVSLLAEVFGDLFGAGWSRPLVFGGFIAAAGLLGSAPLFPLPRGEERTWAPSSRFGHVMPYLPVVVFVGVGLTYVLLGRPFDTESQLAVVLMVGVVFGRQFVELRLNTALSRSLVRERERFAHDAAHDTLTGLANRARLTAELAREPISALLLVDLDGFKAVNDTFGHATGDELLIIVAQRLREASGEEALPARLGGDEFAVLVRRGDVDYARALARGILDRLSEPGLPAAVGASIGIAVATATDRDQLLHEADMAMYEAKNNGKGTYKVYDRELAALAEQRRRLQAELAVALAEGQLFVAYQPVVDLASGASHAAEALVRWQHPVRGPIAPDDFLPAAEDAGLLVEIDRWVLQAAATQLAQWRQIDPAYTIAVNLSVAYLVSGRVVEDVRQALLEHGLPGNSLTVEVTESSLIADLDAAATTLREVKALGVRISLDDFGVGYSSLTYLRKLPVDVVKIDRSFVRELAWDNKAKVLFKAVLDLVHALGLTCVAEGVEEPRQLGQLLAMGCARGQGYLFSPPVTADLVQIGPHRPRARMTASSNT
ncbi:putative bifunctional diguanylate cyclase/phosphodiesterase [Actinoplanes sp. NPDC051494]|uniref:putative bifunctional diguanylate cyclase/phosphodiesterase n=1 Tax=Actinoplanes sp. NPDC051494 TaxID=3363907 RepID=UPI0037B302E8